MHPGLPCENATPDELLSILSWEFQRLPILHNAPIVPGANQIDDDTDLFTTLTNSYLQNVCQRYLLGVEPKNNFAGEQDIMVRYLNYPSFKDPTHPTLREANDRVMYLASNWCVIDLIQIVHLLILTTGRSSTRATSCTAKPLLLSILRSDNLETGPQTLMPRMTKRTKDPTQRLSMTGAECWTGMALHSDSRKEAKGTLRPRGVATCRWRGRAEDVQGLRGRGCWVGQLRDLAPDADVGRDQEKERLNAEAEHDRSRVLDRNGTAF